MNARELLDLIDKHASPHSVRADGLDVKETILRALRLLAAAEANDGTGCELIENLRTEADLCRNETATDIADLLDDAASALIATGAQFNALKDERNGLAARVRELERDAERVRLGLALSLDPLVINSDNIGGIRRSLFLPVDCLWNAMVRELTAERENQPPRHRDDVQQEIDAARGSKP